ncbi:rCG36807 [Rattus norvegicus]|uniref:RCG36807 n=1 Tax=Rattus norvegicus TaxID=10116 RepID=A6JS09_RAT|nr:rCG36807 [Rattus norvegicus]
MLAAAAPQLISLPPTVCFKHKHR